MSYWKHCAFVPDSCVVIVGHPRLPALLLWGSELKKVMLSHLWLACLSGLVFTCCESKWWPWTPIVAWSLRRCSYGWPQWSSHKMFIVLEVRKIQRLLKYHLRLQVGLVKKKSDNFLNQFPHFMKYLHSKFKEHLKVTCFFFFLPHNSA